MEGSSEMELSKNYKSFSKAGDKYCQGTSWTLFDHQEPSEILKIQTKAIGKGNDTDKEAWCIIWEDGIICTWKVL